MSRNTLPVPKKFKPFPDLSQPLPGFGAQLDSKKLDDILPPLLKPLEETVENRYKNNEIPWDEKSAFPYQGGETIALKRLDYYFHQGDAKNPPPVAKYKETRNGLLGHEYSTKLSPFLCLGMLSPRKVMESLDEHEEKYGSTQNTYWVRFELVSVT